MSERRIDALSRRIWRELYRVPVRLAVVRVLFQRLMKAQRLPLHIPVENEHLFRFKMNADSGLRVHHFRTPQSTNSDVR